MNPAAYPVAYSNFGNNQIFPTFNVTNPEIRSRELDAQEYLQSDATLQDLQQHISPHAHCEPWDPTLPTLIEYQSQQGSIKILNYTERLLEFNSDGNLCYEGKKILPPVMNPNGESYMIAYHTWSSSGALGPMISFDIVVKGSAYPEPRRCLIGTHWRISAYALEGTLSVSLAPPNYFKELGAVRPLPSEMRATLEDFQELKSCGAIHPEAIYKPNAKTSVYQVRDAKYTVSNFTAEDISIGVSRRLCINDMEERERFPVGNWRVIASHLELHPEIIAIDLVDDVRKEGMWRRYYQVSFSSMFGKSFSLPCQTTISERQLNRVAVGEAPGVISLKFPVGSEACQPHFNQLWSFISPYANLDCIPKLEEFSHRFEEMDVTTNFYVLNYTSHVLKEREDLDLFVFKMYHGIYRDNASNFYIILYHVVEERDVICMEIKDKKSVCCGRVFIYGKNYYYDWELPKNINEQLLAEPAIHVENKDALLKNPVYGSTMASFPMYNKLKLNDPICKIYSVRTHDMMKYFQKKQSTIPVTLINHTPYNIAVDACGDLNINEIRVAGLEFDEFEAKTICAFQLKKDAKSILLCTIPANTLHALIPSWGGATLAKVKEVRKHIKKAKFFFKAVWLPATDSGSLLNVLPKELLHHIWKLMIALSLSHRKSVYLSQ